VLFNIHIKNTAFENTRKKSEGMPLRMHSCSNDSYNVPGMGGSQTYVVYGLPKRHGSDPLFLEEKIIEIVLITKKMFTTQISIFAQVNGKRNCVFIPN
jgi:hypothetical protein